MGAVGNIEIRRLPTDDDSRRRYAAELWLPYHRELAAAVDAHTLAGWPDERFSEKHGFEDHRRRMTIDVDQT